MLHSVLPHMRRRKISIRLPMWLLAWMDDQDFTQTSLIERAIIHAYGLTSPDDPRTAQKIVRLIQAVDDTPMPKKRRSR